MTCDVNFSDQSDDADPVEFFDERFVVGRKDHACVECREAIPIGTRHLRKSYRFEGAFHVDRVCDACRETAAEFKLRIIGGELWQSMREAWSEGARVTACMNRLTTTAAKAKMQAQYNAWQDRLRRTRARPNPPTP